MTSCPFVSYYASILRKYVQHPQIAYYDQRLQMPGTQFDVLNIDINNGNKNKKNLSYIQKKTGIANTMELVYLA